MIATTLHCDQCEALSINGIPCHETGCPLSHIDLRTGKPHQAECDWCGSLCDQAPQGKSFCDDDCQSSYWS